MDAKRVQEIREQHTRDGQRLAGMWPRVYAERAHAHRGELLDALDEAETALVKMTEERDREYEARRVNERLVLEYRERGDSWQHDFLKAEATIERLRKTITHALWTWDDVRNSDGAREDAWEAVSGVLRAALAEEGTPR